jgi:hypothetical protein
LSLFPFGLLFERHFQGRGLLGRGIVSLLRVEGIGFWVQGFKNLFWHHDFYFSEKSYF